MGINFYALNSLDEAIDQICDVLGESNMDDALKEDMCPYFGIPWEAGLGLTKYLLENSNFDLNNKTVLEIGCGLALPSFAATQLGAKTLACDFHDDVETFIKENQKLNDINFAYKKINWRDEDNQIGFFDFVIGSDILYESTHPINVAKSLLRYAKPKATIILSDPGRAYINKFLLAMKELNLFHQRVDLKIKDKTIQVYIFQT